MTTQNTEDNWEQDYYELYSGGVAFETVDEVTKQRYIDFKKIGYYFKSLLAKREQELEKKHREEIRGLVVDMVTDSLDTDHMETAKVSGIINECYKHYGLAEFSGKEQKL